MGSSSFEMRVEGPGGHASMPTRMGPTARLVRAIVRIDQSPFPARLPAPATELFSRLAPHAPAPLRPLMAHAAKMAPVLTRALVLAGPESAALARTTVAVTTLSGSPALNVIASSATAGVNVRIMPGESVASTQRHLEKAIRDEHVHLDLVASSEPSPISRYEDEPAFALVEECVAEVFPDAVTSPYVLMGATDSRFFTAICPCVYRFAPFRMSRAQRASIHSHDERIGVDDFAEGVRWYTRLIERLS